MKKKVIAVDFDDVVVPTGPLILESYNQRYGTTLTLENLYNHDHALWNVEREDTLLQRVDEILKTYEYQNVPPLPETVSAIRELSKHHELHIVTGRSDYLQEATYRTAQTYFPDMFISAAFTNYFKHNARSKADVCQELGADLLIDDHLHHAERVAQCGINVVLFGDYPWNQADELPPLIQRANSWADVTQLLT